MQRVLEIRERREREREERNDEEWPGIGEACVDDDPCGEAGYV